MEHDTKDEILVAGNATVQRGLHLHQLDKDGEGIEKEREREKKDEREGGSRTKWANMVKKKKYIILEEKGYTIIYDSPTV